MTSLKRTITLISAAIAGGNAVNAMAAPLFNGGDLVVLDVATNTSVAGATYTANSPVSLYDFSTSISGQTAPVSSLAFAPPSSNTGSSTSAGFGISATAGSEGALSLTTGTGPTEIILGGYQGTNTSGASGLLDRVAVAADPVAGTYTLDHYNESTDGAGTTGVNIRSVVSNDGSNFYVVEGGGGGNILYLNSSGATTPVINSAMTSSATTTSSSANMRVAQIYNGQLYVTSGSGVIQGLNQVGTGLPTSGATLTHFSGFPTSSTTSTSTSQAAASSYSYYFANSNLLFLADSSTATGTSASGGINVWSNSGTGAGAAGAWSRIAEFQQDTGLFGITGTVSGNTVDLFATDGDGALANNLIETTFNLSNDTFASTYTTLATAAAGNGFRGLVLLPAATTVPEPASIALLGLSGSALLMRRRNKSAGNA